MTASPALLAVFGSEREVLRITTSQGCHQPLIRDQTLCVSKRRPKLTVDASRHAWRTAIRLSSPSELTPSYEGLDQVSSTLS
jgi:hypothetical protein